MFPLKLPHGSNSNKYTQHSIISIKSPELIPNTIKFAAMGSWVFLVFFFC